MTSPYTSGLYESFPLLRKVMDKSAELESGHTSYSTIINSQGGKKKKRNGGHAVARGRKQSALPVIQPVANKNKHWTTEAQLLPLAFLHKTLQAGPSVCCLRIATQGYYESCQNGTFSTCTEDGDDNNKALVEGMQNNNKHGGGVFPDKRLNSCTHFHCCPRRSWR